MRRWPAAEARRSRIWLQLTADVCGLPISVARHADACGVLGSAICSSCAAGAYGSLAEAAANMVAEESKILPRGNSGQYEKSYQTYLRLYEATRTLL